MRLWIDGQCLQTGSRLRGIGRYVSQLIRAIGEHCPQVEMSISFNAAMPDAGIAARDDVRPWIAPQNIHVWQGIRHGGEGIAGYTNDYRLAEAAIAHHMAVIAPDIALSASPFEGQYDPATPLLSGAGHAIPRAAIFYDVIPNRYPDRYLTKEKEARCYRRRIAGHRDFDLLLAISDFARREAEEILPDVKAVRIDAGISPDFITLSRQAADPGALIRLGIRKPFLLYIGGIDWRKNLGRVREACALLPQKWKDELQLVMAGDIRPDWLAAYRGEWVKAGLPDANLVGLGHITDENLVQLYKQADLVIQPSLMEGFGLTALEAMFCGAPVVASNAGALPEVVGDERALFDPLKPAMMATRITQLLSDPALAKSLVTQGIARAATFSWERTARAALTALEAAARRPAPQSLSQIRHITRTHLGKAPDPERAALVLACAEPRPAAAARLLIDVTSITSKDPGTGIQRVVKNIARALVQQKRHQLFWCETDDGFTRAEFDLAGLLQRAPQTPQNHIVPGARDHILMLDSSWIYWRHYNKVMRRARLQGSDITTVLYDLTPLKLPAFCVPAMPQSFGDWLKSALLYSTGFVCISKAVADEFLALLEAIHFPRPMKIGYWRLGAVPPEGAGRATTADPAAPMFLMVSTIEPRKGYRVALDAFSALWREGFAGTLCIIGHRGWGVEHLVADMMAHPEWGKKLFWLEGADDKVLQAHYAACTALVASSYAEGFGLPIVEAAQHGKPVIASDIPVFREVAGEGAGVRYFPSGSASGLVDAVKDFLARHGNAPPTRQDKPVTWTASAAALEDIVTADHWYRTYQPSHPDSEILLDAIGDLTPAPPKDVGDRRHRLELVEGPIPAPHGGGVKFVVRVTNLSDLVWSSAGPDGVRLGVRLVGRAGKSHFSKIPLIHIPGDTHYMAVEIPARQMGHATGAEIALVQGTQWWDGGLRVALAS